MKGYSHNISISVVDVKNVNDWQFQDKLCCTLMDIVIEDKESALRYDPSLRMYYIREEHQPAARTIQYCPWCAAKLPESLYNEQEEILEKEYGLTDTWKGGKDYDQIPPEFHTDEWWKKRGL